MSQEKKRKRKKNKKKKFNINLKKSDDFLIKYGNEIPIIPEHIISKTNSKGEEIIISLNDDNRYIQLTRDMRTVWQMIDGKRTWKEILNTNFQYNTQEKNQLIYKIISQIFKNDWGSIEQSNHKNRDIVIHGISDQESIEWDKSSKDEDEENSWTTIFGYGDGDGPSYDSGS